MKVGIIGCGAIGLLTASYLSVSHDVTLYARKKQQVAELMQEGFTRVGLDGKRDHFFIKTKLLEDYTDEQLVIICVKQYNLTAVLAKLKQYSTMPILFLQNGMGHEQLACDLDNPVYIGITDHGARKVNNTQVVHTGVGRVMIGCVKGDSASFYQITGELNTLEFPVVPEENWRSIQQWKLIANAVINPLTALYRVENGAVLKNLELKKMAKELCSEAADILGMDSDKAWAHCAAIIKKTSANRSSMLQDIEAGRKTEIQSILGYLINESDRIYPTMMFLHRSISVLEAESARKQEAR